METCIYVDDLVAAERFYVDVLGLERITRDAGRDAFFRCGDGVFLLFDPAATIEGGERPPHGGRGAGHVAFVLEPDDVDAWLAKFAAAGVAIERDLSPPEGGRSLYFRDPAGNSVELATRQVWGIG